MPELPLHTHRVHVEITLENGLDMQDPKVQRDIERLVKGYDTVATPLNHNHFLDVEVIKVETEA